jgi:hypothetical protein
MEDWEGAKRDLKRCLELDPENKSVARELKKLQVGVGVWVGMWVGMWVGVCGWVC